MNEPKETKDMLETMQEMMRQLTVLTKNMASFHDPERHRNPYGPRTYWNNNRGPERDPNRRRPSIQRILRREMLIGVMKMMKNHRTPTTLMTNQTISTLSMIYLLMMALEEFS